MTLHEATQRIKNAARELAREDLLCDPSDDDILIYAAELAEGCDRVDLLALSDGQRNAIIKAYDRVYYDTFTRV